MAAGPEKGTRGSYSIIFCLLDFSGWQIIWGYMTLFPKTPVKRNIYQQLNEVCKPYLLFGLLKTWRYAQTRPTFTHQFLWLWGSPHSKTQMPLLRKLRWRAHRCVPSPQDLEIWTYSCFTSESTRRWVDLRPKTPSLLCVVYHHHLYMLYLPFMYIHIYIYMYVMIYVWSDESVHTMTMGLTLQRHVGTPIPPNGRSLDPGRSPLSSIQVHSWLVRIVVNRNQLPSSDWFYWRSLESNKTFEKQSLEKSCAKCASVYIRNSSYTGEDEGNGCNLLIPRPSCMITITFFSPQTPQSTLVWSSVF